LFQSSAPIADDEMTFPGGNLNEDFFSRKRISRSGGRSLSNGLG